MEKSYVFKLLKRHNYFNGTYDVRNPYRKIVTTSLTLREPLDLRRVDPLHHRGEVRPLTGICLLMSDPANKFNSIQNIVYSVGFDLHINLFHL